MSRPLRDRITVIGGTPKPGDTHVAAYVPIDLAGGDPFEGLGQDAWLDRLFYTARAS